VPDPFVGVRFPADLLRQLDQEAGGNRSALIRVSVQRELERRAAANVNSEPEIEREENWIFPEETQ
jgi:metal-responsive CopG/Arc/MetJ family transcriptional regulator